MHIPESQAEQVQWLREHCAPLHKANPSLPLGELVKLLPEPDRSIAHNIVFATVSLDELPIERAHRQPWHDAVERTLVTITNDETQQRFSTGDVLADSGIDDPDLPEYDHAFNYANVLLTAACGRPIRQPQMVA